MVAEEGVMVTVASVSSPGEMEVRLISGGERRSAEEELWLEASVAAAFIVLEAAAAFVKSTATELATFFSSSAPILLGPISVSGVSSTEMLRRDMESSEDKVLEETAWDPYPL